MFSKRRDLSLINFDEKTLVISSDSCGGIGNKENDFLKVSPFYVGALTTRVVLMEVLSTGAEVISISNAVCNEMNDTGKVIIKGIQSELKKANVKIETITGSTEENIPTSMTALGMTCIGAKNTIDLKFGKANKNDYIVVYGIPKVGDELDLENDDCIAKYTDINDLVNFNGLIELSPTGSKGILHECLELSKLNNLTFNQIDNVNINLDKSCGVSTCLVAVIKKNYINDLPKTITPITVVGVLS